MAFPVGNTIVSAIPVGNKWLVTWDHTGPASYSQTTGDVVNAADIGFGGFECVDSTVDTTSQLQPYVEHSSGGYGNAVASVELSWFSLVTATLGGQSQTAGTEVAATSNISTFSVRLQAWCV
jgi:hypothetical protein